MQECDRGLARLAAIQYGLLTREQAMTLGLTPRMVQTRLGSGWWERLDRSVYRLVSHERSWEQDILAACFIYGSRSLASHRSSAALHGLAGSRRLAIELTVPRGHARARPGIMVYRRADSLHPADKSMAGPIPVTAPARTLLDLAAILPFNSVEEAVDDALARRLVTPTRLRWQLQKDARRGREGIAVMRAILRERGITDPVKESVLETRLARILRRAKIPVAPQYEIRSGNRFIARVDFAIPPLQIAVEADGYGHHSGRARWERDLARGNRLAAMGWFVFHVTSTDISERPDDLVRELRAAIAARALTAAR